MPRVSQLSWTRSLSLSSLAAAGSSPQPIHPDPPRPPTRTRTTYTPSADPLWSKLPPEIVRRIWHECRRHRAATRIQAFWRGRDVRDWLKYPGALVLNRAHPSYDAKCHLKSCVDCYVRSVIEWRVLQNRFLNPAFCFAWVWRGPYLEQFEPGP